MTTSERVLGALATVYDPELDEPITSLRFVSSCDVTDAGDVDILLRLPTPQCAPNFAFLMAADALGAVRRLPEVRRVSVRLEDHYTGEEINAALAAGEGFTGAFPGETNDDSLESLRALFTRKALVARQTRVCETLRASAGSEAEVVSLRVADLPREDPEVRRCLELRAALGISCDPGAAAFVSPNGDPVSADQLDRWLRMGRLVRTSLEANGGICRSLLQFRHNLAADPLQEVAR
jgi:metal-sulfur cluster biosynthetic enzyme